MQGIIAAATRQRIGTAVTGERVAKIRTGNILDIEQGVTAITGRCSKPEIDRDTARRRAVIHRVGAGPAIQDIVAATADQYVLAAVTHQMIVARTTNERVIAAITMYDVIEIP